MSRYIPRTYYATPDKKVSPEQIEKLFLTIKTGDLNQIRGYINETGIKLNVIQPETLKTPAHAVLELNNKIADNRTKLKLLEYLKQNGATIDLPDSNGIWPVHLAAATQDPDIINFFIQSGARMDATDASNNTPLHYAVKGAVVDCPVSLIPKPLSLPSQKTSVSAIDSVTKQISLMISNNDPAVNSVLIGIINTISDISTNYPELTQTIQNDIINQFSRIATSGDVMAQTTALEQIVDSTYNQVKGLIGLEPLSIKPDNGGWGPTWDGVAPTNTEKIMPVVISDRVEQINANIMSQRVTLQASAYRDNNSTVLIGIPQLLGTIDEEYIIPSMTNDLYYEKMLYLLINARRRDWDTFRSILARNLIDVSIMSEEQFNKHINGDSVSIEEEVLFENIFATLFPDIRSPNYKFMDDYIESNANNCFIEFTENMTGPLDQSSKFMVETMEEIINKPEYAVLNSDYLRLFSPNDDRKTFDQLIIEEYEEVRDQLYSDYNISTTDAIESDINGNFLNSRYTTITIATMFETLSSIQNLETGSPRNAYPTPFSLRLSDIDSFVMGRNYPGITDQIRFLERLFYRYLQQDINEKMNICIKNFIDTVTDSQSTDATAINITASMTPLTELSAIMTNLPVTVDDPDELELVFGTAKELQSINNLIVAFDTWINSIARDPIFADIYSEIIDGLDEIDWPSEQNTDWQNVLFGFGEIQKSLSELNMEGGYRMIIRSDSFRKIIDNFFGDTFKRRMLMAAHAVDTDDILNDFIVQLNNDKMTPGFFFNEYIRGIYFMAYDRIQMISDAVRNINIIMDDISDFLIYEFYYYIPQILLPALIKETVESITVIIQMRNKLKLENENINSFAQNNRRLGDDRDLDLLRIFTFSNNFMRLINERISQYYITVSSMTKYHNEVMTYLNTSSAARYLNNLVTRPNDMELDNIFAGVLPMIGDFPPELKDIVQFNLNDEKEGIDINFINNMLRDYNYQHVNYYTQDFTNTDEIMNKLDEILSDEDTSDPNESIFLKYRDIMSFERYNSIDLSDSPKLGNNLQINIVQDNTLAPDELRLINLTNSIDGQMLVLNDDETNNNFGTLMFNNAFISFEQGDDITDNYIKSGFPKNIRFMMSNYLSLGKQATIEEVLQEIVDNRDDNPIYNAVNDISNSTYTPNRTLNFVVIAKIIDGVLDQLLDYSIRQSVSEWVYSLMGLGPYEKIINTDTIRIIGKKNLSKINLSVVNTDIGNLIGSDRQMVSDTVNRIEENPDNLVFTSNYGKEKDFMHYLYDLDYFSADRESTKTCYRLNPDAVSLIVSPGNLNRQNSTGMTPAHYAISMMNPDLVKMLISKGARFDTIYNNNSKTAYQMFRELFISHLSVLNSNTLNDTIQKFAAPFNDLMTSRLLEGNFNNNITKNVTLAIPIEFCIYNHMFFSYLNNYRYGFDIALRNDVRNLIQNYYGFSYMPDVYPVDLFEVSDLNSVLQGLYLENTYGEELNKMNSKKQTRYINEISMIDSQIQNLNTEKSTSNNVERITAIDDLITRLSLRRADIDNKMRKIQAGGVVQVDDYLIMHYITLFDRMKNDSSRGLTIIEFYDKSFDSISSDKRIQQDIWKNYVNKEINQTPSMIFVLINKILEEQLQNPNKSDIQIIARFYEKVKNYIETKKSLPQNMEDNYILEEEFHHITYLVSLIITQPVLKTIRQTIYETLKEIDPILLMSRSPLDIVNDIMNTRYENRTIPEYITMVLPRRIVKYYTSVFEQNDPDENTKSSSDLFTPIINAIKLNRVIQVDDSSPLIQNLTSTIIPYLIDSYQNFIYHIRLSIFGMEKYLENTDQYVQMLSYIVN